VISRVREIKRSFGFFFLYLAKNGHFSMIHASEGIEVESSRNSIILRDLSLYRGKFK
jgi:hypothetical protein